MIVGAGNFRQGAAIAVLGPIVPFRRSAAFAFVFAMSIASTDARAIFIATEPWVRPAASGQSTEAYVLLTSTEGATLVGARCAVAASIELRSTTTGHSSLGALPLPAGKEVALAPKANRFVLRGVKKPLRLGDRVPIVLVVQSGNGTRQEIPLDAEVRLHSPTEDHLRPHTH
jgi:copper(I)-binding protein